MLSDTDAAPCPPVHSAWHMSACPRVVTAPSILRRWCPRPPNRTRCSLTACPTRSTWQSSKPRLPVPRTFTLLCWTVPTRSRARRLHRLQALGAPCELAGLGAGQAEGEGDREGMKNDLKARLSLTFLAARALWPEPAGGSRGWRGAWRASPRLCPGGLLPAEPRMHFGLPVDALFQGLSPSLAWVGPLASLLQPSPVPSQFRGGLSDCVPLAFPLHVSKARVCWLCLIWSLSVSFSVPLWSCLRPSLFWISPLLLSSAPSS